MVGIRSYEGILGSRLGIWDVSCRSVLGDTLSVTLACRAITWKEADASRAILEEPLM